MRRNRADVPNAETRNTSPKLRPNYHLKYERVIERVLLRYAFPSRKGTPFWATSTANSTSGEHPLEEQITVPTINLHRIGAVLIVRRLFEY
jgi:hypothetical protein